MEIEIKNKIKNIQTIREYNISFSNMDGGYIDIEFSFRLVEDEDGHHFLYPFGVEKWTKNPQKILKEMNIEQTVLEDVLFEFVCMKPYVGEKISSLDIFDFEEKDIEFYESD